jgi:hypothetical protein
MLGRLEFFVYSSDGIFEKKTQLNLLCVFFSFLLQDPWKVYLINKTIQHILLRFYLTTKTCFGGVWSFEHQLQFF